MILYIMKKSFTTWKVVKKHLHNEEMTTRWIVFAHSFTLESPYYLYKVLYIHNNNMKKTYLKVSENEYTINIIVCILFYII